MKKQTTNYELFKFLKCNREISENLVQKIKKSIELRNMLEFRPVLVDPQMNILDGQHRLQAAKLLGVPVWYEIQDDGSHADIIHFNAFQKPWGHLDFVNYYAANGNQNYIKFKKFLEKYKITPKVATALVTDSSQNRTRDDLALGRIAYNEERASVATRLMDRVGECIEAMKKASPALAIEKMWMTGSRFKESVIGFLMLDDVDSETFIKKIPQRSDLLSAKPGAAGYFDMFRSIYNYRNQNPIP